MRKPRNGNGFGKTKPKGYQPPKEQCHQCKEWRFVYKRINGRPLCRQCAKIPKHRCIRCRKIKIINAWEKDGPVCLDCYERPTDICSHCGKKGAIVVREDGETICRQCYIPPFHQCSVCGRLAPLARKNPAQCNTCYVRLRNQQLKHEKSR